MKQILYLSIILFLCYACSSTTTEPVVQAPAPVVEAPAEPDNPCMTLAKLTPRQRDEAETAYVLYRDELKFERYDEALKLWRKAYRLAPAANGRFTYQFRDGARLYKDLFNKTTDQEMKQALVDTIYAIYDKQEECFGQDATIAARKGFDAYYTFGEFISEDQAFDYLREAVDSKGTEVDYFVINPFTKMLYDRIVTDRIDKTIGREYADIIYKTIDKGLSECEKCEPWEIINDYAPKRLEALEGVNMFYECAYYEAKFVPEYEASPEDCEVIANITRKLKWGRCPDENPNMIALANAKKTHCYTPPPPPGPLRIAFDLYNQGQYPTAIQKFEEFVNKTDDVSKKAKYTLLIAKIYYGDIKDFRQARKYALKAAEYRANWGEPFILIGKLYASSGPLCGPGRGWDSQIVTWPAIDKFEYAKKIDPSVAAEANKWIAQYKKYMPSTEDIFQRGKSNGDSFTVPCWIQERTTIRAAK